MTRSWSTDCRAAIAGVRIAALGAAPSGARAGESACSDRLPPVAEVVQAAAAAKRLERALDDTGADIAIIGRVGADLSRHGVTWTHAGIAWRDDPAGRWQIRHALNERAGPTSRLYRQGLMNFFLDGPWTYDALVLVPGPELRAGLLARLEAGSVEALHQPRYSVVAYPFATTYQNSNQFVLENLALARVGRLDASRAAAIAELRQSGFEPHTVRFTRLERLGGRFRANVRFDDHPRTAANDNRYAVVTVQAIERWLASTGNLSASIEVRPQ
ncbi:MAG TPA: DUF2145 domain-containing protein [Vineibacter terrae]|nr:DUF2145 domain-containing protein [Vineibacter terrae]